MSDNPLTWPMIAALPIEARELSETRLAALPALASFPFEATWLAEAPSRSTRP